MPPWGRATGVNHFTAASSCRRVSMHTEVSETSATRTRRPLHDEKTKRIRDDTRSLSARLPVWSRATNRAGGSVRNAQRATQPYS